MKNLSDNNLGGNINFKAESKIFANALKKVAPNFNSTKNFQRNCTEENLNKEAELTKSTKISKREQQKQPIVNTKLLLFCNHSKKDKKETENNPRLLPHTRSSDVLSVNSGYESFAHELENITNKLKMNSDIYSEAAKLLSTSNESLDYHTENLADEQSIKYSSPIGACELKNHTNQLKMDPNIYTKAAMRLSPSNEILDHVTENLADEHSIKYSFPLNACEVKNPTNQLKMNPDIYKNAALLLSVSNESLDQDSENLADEHSIKCTSPLNTQKLVNHNNQLKISPDVYAKAAFLLSTSDESLEQELKNLADIYSIKCDTPINIYELENHINQLKMNLDIDTQSAFLLSGPNKSLEHDLKNIDEHSIKGAPYAATKIKSSFYNNPEFEFKNLNQTLNRSYLAKTTPNSSPMSFNSSGYHSASQSSSFLELENYESSSLFSTSSSYSPSNSLHDESVTCKHTMRNSSDFDNQHLGKNKLFGEIQFQSSPSGKMVHDFKKQIKQFPSKVNASIEVEPVLSEKIQIKTGNGKFKNSSYLKNSSDGYIHKNLSNCTPSDSLENEPLATSLSLGSRILWLKERQAASGVVRWIGRIPSISHDWTAGVEFDNAMPDGGSGDFQGRCFFNSRPKHSLFLPVSDVFKVEDNPSNATGTTRMSNTFYNPTHKAGSVGKLNKFPGKSMLYTYDENNKNSNSTKWETFFSSRPKSQFESCGSRRLKATDIPKEPLKYPLPTKAREFEYPVDRLLSFSEGTFIDTHCHLDILLDKIDYKASFTDYRREYPLEFPPSYGGCVTIFCNPFSFTKTLLWKKLLSEQYIWAAFGCHPKNADHYSDSVEDSLCLALSHPQVRALGEIGLDYSERSMCPKSKQKEVFIRQIMIGIAFNLPLVIHCRDAYDDCLEILKEFVLLNHAIHLHCFSSKWDIAKKFLDTFPNLCIGVTNLITFQSSCEVQEVVRNIPLNRLLLETDAPYFIPRALARKFRVSHPGMAIFVAAKVASLKNIPLKKVLSATRKNTNKVYKI